MKKSIVLLYLLIFGHCFAFAQHNNCYKKIPYFLSLSPAKLARRLTRNCKTDSEKVCVIHSWITHKIKYDVKKWLKFDYNYQSPKKILWKRKTTCVGYSELFDVLCKYSSVQSLTVSGYVKDKNVNITDNYFIDEHTWNAVFIKGEWSLLDPCWDAGYIKYTKRTFIGFFVYLFSGGKNNIIKYKPHFVVFPTNQYFLKPPTFFKTDHLPLNPMWQLLSPIISLKKFKSDSDYYFERHHLIFLNFNNHDKYEDERLNYLSADSNNRLASDGNMGYQFNHKNHWEIGIFNALQTEMRMKGINKKSKDTLQQLNVCDSVLKYANRALIHLDSNSYYLIQQKTELKNSNKLKNETMSKQNDKLISVTKKIITNFIRGKSMSNTDNKMLKSMVNSNNNRLNSALKNTYYYRKKITTIYSGVELQNQALSLNTITDSIVHQEKKIIKLYASLDSLFKRDSANIILHTTTLPLILQREKVVIQNRTSFYDDLDYEIRSPKDTLLKYKFKNDSLLYAQNNFRIIDLLSRFRKMRTKVNNLISLYRLKNQMIKDFKNQYINISIQNNEYSENLNQWQFQVNLIDGLLAKWTNRFNELKTYCIENKMMTKIELKEYFQEKRLENYFYPIRNKYINKHASSLIKTNNKLAAQIKTIKSNILSYKEKLSKL